MRQEEHENRGNLCEAGGQQEAGNGGNGHQNGGGMGAWRIAAQKT